MKRQKIRKINKIRSNVSLDLSRSEIRDIIIHTRIKFAKHNRIFSRRI
jgi:hypothetical protein